MLKTVIVRAILYINKYSCCIQAVSKSKKSISWYVGTHNNHLFGKCDSKLLTKQQHGIKRVNLSDRAKVEKGKRDAEKSSNYCELTRIVFDQRDSGDHSDDAFANTTTILLLNPEFYTIWNWRRRILISWGVGTEKVSYHLKKDLMMVMGILRRFPKCYWVWNHRCWCLELLADEADWEYEFAVVQKLLEADPRNFHGWQYRRIIVSHLEEDKSPEAILLIKLREFDYTTDKAAINPLQFTGSNYLAWHNRLKLIPQIYDLARQVTSGDYGELFKIFESPFEIMKHDLDLVATGMYMESNDTLVWTYFKWLLTAPFFVDALTPLEYNEVLKAQFNMVRELNELEFNENGQNHPECLKAMLFLDKLLNTATKEPTPQAIEWLKLLVEIDPMRGNRYRDQLG